MNNAETSVFEWQPKIPCEHERLAGPSPHGGSLARNLQPFCCSLSSQRWPLEHFGSAGGGGGGEAALTSGATNHQTEHKAEICQRKILNSTVLS